MAWSSSDRRARLPANWDAIRSAFKRKRMALDGGRCQGRLPSGKRCPRLGTDADHRSDPDNHDDLQWLCRKHHDDKTQNEARAPGREVRRLKYRPAEEHPGDLR